MRFTQTLSIVGVALGLAVGCAPSNPGVVAEGVLTSDSMCVVTATNNLLVQGTFDLETDPATAPRTGVTYAVAVKIANQLINTGNRVYPLQADTDRFIVDHIEVTLLDQQEATIGIPGAPNPYLVPASGAAASTNSTDPTFGIATATVIPDGYGRALAAMPQFARGTNATLLLRLRVIGTTAGGSAITTGPITFPVHTCVGCLFVGGGCDAMGLPITSTACLPGQDALTVYDSCPAAAP